MVCFCRWSVAVNTEAKRKGTADLLSCKLLVEMVWMLCQDNLVLDSYQLNEWFREDLWCSVVKTCPVRPSLLGVPVTSSEGLHVRTVENSCHGCGTRRTKVPSSNFATNVACPQAKHFIFLCRQIFYLWLQILGFELVHCFSCFRGSAAAGASFTTKGAPAQAWICPIGFSCLKRGESGREMVREMAKNQMRRLPATQSMSRGFLSFSFLSVINGSGKYERCQA